MTSGVLNLDFTTAVSAGCGSGMSGYTFYKTWSGANQSTSIPAARTGVREMKTWRLEPYISKEGKRKIRRVEGPAIYRDVYSRPKPKRSYVRDEHSYNMSLNRHIDCYVLFKYPGQGLRNGHTNLCFGTMFGFTPSVWSSNNDLELINKLRDKLLGDSDFDIGVFLAELPQAAAMIANSAYRLERAIYYARRGNFREAERYLLTGRRQVLERSRSLDAANNWLELQYGWLPLLSDAYHGAQQLSHMANEPFQHVVRVARKVKESVPSSSNCVPAQATCFTRKSLKALIKEVNVPKLTGLTNPETMLWEKLPWSFCADWFIPIGDYLQARGVASAVSGVFTTSTIRRQEIRGLKPGPSLERLQLSGTFRDDRVDFTRTVSTSLDVPLPSFKPLGKVASWRHAANAVALLLQQTHSSNLPIYTGPGGVRLS